MDKNKYDTNPKKDKEAIEQAAEAWARLCIYNIRQKKELDNQNKKEYEYNAK